MGAATTMEDSDIGKGWCLKSSSPFWSSPFSGSAAVAAASCRPGLVLSKIVKARSATTSYN